MINDDLGGLTETLEGMGLPELEKLEEDLEDVVKTASVSSCKKDSSFYSQHPDRVAEGLLGAKIIRRLPDGQCIGAYIMEVDSWDRPIHDGQESRYRDAPGSIYFYKSTRGNFLAIAAHPEGGDGVVRIVKVLITGKGKPYTLTSSKILDGLQIGEQFDRECVNGNDLTIERASNPLSTPSASDRPWKSIGQRKKGNDDKWSNRYFLCTKV